MFLTLYQHYTQYSVRFFFPLLPSPACPSYAPTNYKPLNHTPLTHTHPPHRTAQASQPPKTPRTTHPVSHKPHAQKQLTSQPYARQRCSHAPLSAFMQMARFVHVYARRTRLVPPVLVVPPPPPLRLALLLALALAETAPLLPAESTLVEEPIVLMVVRQS